MKYNICFICLFLLFESFSAQTSYVYRPMTTSKINFGEDVCYYQEVSSDSNFAYVKPCKEGKKCVYLGISPYNIYACKDYDDEVYDNKGETCQTKDHFSDSNVYSGTDCTNYLCDSHEKCGSCPKTQVYDQKNDRCQSTDPGYCEEYKFDSTTGVRTLENDFLPYENKMCAEIILQSTKSTSTVYQIQKINSNYIAELDDGKYIYDYYYVTSCKSGFALYFYGDGKLTNPNTNTGNSEKMFLRCVTVLGKDTNGIIKYKIGDDVRYYDPDKLPSSYRTYLTQYLYASDDFLMLRLELFSNYKNRLDSLTNCRETNCDDDELSKWKYFYTHPNQYLLYQNEPQVMEYLIQSSYPKYKAKHTSSNGAESLFNIKYLSLLSLLLLF